MNSTEPTPTTDETLHVLADSRRRAVLRHLRRRDGAVVTLDGLVASLTEGTETQSAVDADPERLRVSLRHVHLPKLAGAGLVEYDTDGETLRYRSDEAVEMLLEFLGEDLPQRRQA